MVSSGVLENPPNPFLTTRCCVGIVGLQDVSDVDHRPSRLAERLGHALDVRDGRGEELHVDPGLGVLACAMRERAVRVDEVVLHVDDDEG
jgi:hypothetical protein